MPHYFRSWKRKLGIVTLMMACVFTAGWVRSRAIADVIDLPGCHLVSINDGLISEATTNYSAGKWWTGFDYDGAFNAPDPFSDPETELSWRWRLFGFGVADYHERNFAISGPLLQYPKTVYRLPYWSIVIPLTLLSAYLLLSNPRAKPGPTQS